MLPLKKRKRRRLVNYLHNMGQFKKKRKEINVVNSSIYPKLEITLTKINLDYKSPFFTENILHRYKHK